MFLEGNFQYFARRKKKLYVNIDHIASLRQSRLTNYPSLSTAIGICEILGIDGITFHLREDRRHIQDKDVFLFKEISTLPLNFELALNEDIINIALEVKPYRVTIVPEKRLELTTETGFKISQINKKDKEKLLNFIHQFQKKNINVCLFLDPNIEDIIEAYSIGIEEVEINTGVYSQKYSNEKDRIKELNLIKLASDEACKKNMKVYAGHGLHYKNLNPLLLIDTIQEFNIGHGIISRAIFLGLKNAIQEIQNILMENFLLKGIPLEIEKI